MVMVPHYYGVTDTSWELTLRGSVLISNAALAGKVVGKRHYIFKHPLYLTPGRNPMQLLTRELISKKSNNPRGRGGHSLYSDDREGNF